MYTQIPSLYTPTAPRETEGLVLIRRAKSKLLPVQLDLPLHEADEECLRSPPLHFSSNSARIGAGSRVDVLGELGGEVS
jgi:hypothetical protein